MVQPAEAAPSSINKDDNMIVLDAKKNQYDNMLRKPEAISRAPICKGINKFENVPLKPPVNTKNTMMVPWMVTRAKYALGSRIPSFPHLRPMMASMNANFSPGQANCRRKIIDITIATTAIITAVIKNWREITLWSMLNTYLLTKVS